MGKERNRELVMTSRRIAAGSLVAVLSMCAGTATAGTPSPTPAVRIGPPAALPSGARAIGALPNTTPLHLTIALKPRDPAALSDAVDAVSTPGSPTFRHYLTPAEFGAEYGAAPDTIAAVQQALRDDGLSPGAPAVDGLSIPITAPAGAVAAAFSTSFDSVALPGGGSAYVNGAAPALPADVAADIQTVTGLSDTTRFQPLGLLRADRAAAPGSHVVTGGPQPCAAATTTGSATADQIASAYSLAGIYGAGDLGAGQTVALVEFEGDFPSDIATYDSCYGLVNRVTNVAVAGGPTTPLRANEDGIESALDIDTIAGLAPGAKIRVYQAPNSIAGSTMYQAIVNENAAKVISTSWGLCEPDDEASDIAAENTIFQQAAMQGISVFAAAGDDGSEDCNTGNSPDDELAVDDPGSQPYVTSVGGTTLTGGGPPPSETVWNNSIGAGGGGISSVWTMPAYQSNAPGPLGVINAQSSNTPCGAASGAYCREVPDVAADADPGYAVYWGTRWGGIEGTSFAAPEWGALAALADASGSCAGVSIGQANPLLYSAASSGSADFNDITSGNNDFTGAHAGTYPAGTGYDMASGLGSPIGSALVPALCHPLSLTNPGAQTGTVGTPVALQLKAVAADGGAVTFSAAGLPAGLSISSSGAVTGTPSVQGTSTVTVTAAESSGASASTSFSWTINAAAATTTATTPATTAPTTTTTTSTTTTVITPPTTPGGTPPPASGVSQVSVARVRGADVLRFKAAGPGRLRVTIGGRARSYGVASAGTHAVKLALPAHLRGRLRHARRHRLAVTISLRFTPTGGTPRTSRLKVTLRA